jgi:hypothetical protein
MSIREQVQFTTNVKGASLYVYVCNVCVDIYYQKRPVVYISKTLRLTVSRQHVVGLG